MNAGGPLGALGRVVFFAGLLLTLLGLCLIFAPRLPFLGRLPGDLHWTRGNFRVEVPLATSLLISVALTILLAILSRLRR